MSENSNAMQMPPSKAVRRPTEETRAEKETSEMMND